MITLSDYVDYWSSWFVYLPLRFKNKGLTSLSELQFSQTIAIAILILPCVSFRSTFKDCLLILFFFSMHSPIEQSSMVGISVLECEHSNSTQYFLNMGDGLELDLSFINSPIWNIHSSLSLPTYFFQLQTWWVFINLPIIYIELCWWAIDPLTFSNYHLSFVALSQEIVDAFAIREVLFVNVSLIKIIVAYDDCFPFVIKPFYFATLEDQAVILD